MSRKKKSGIYDTPIIRAVKAIEDGITDQKERGPIRDYIVGYDGTILQVGSEAIVGRDEWGYEGIGQVIEIDSRKNRALVKFYPWLSPGFRYGKDWFGAEILRLDNYKIREQR